MVGLELFSRPMSLQLDAEALKRLIVVGDKVLIKPRAPRDKTGSGLFLPPGVEEQEKLQSGYVIRTGPGYALPAQEDPDESWKPGSGGLKYMPLEATAGDLAVYLQRNAWEIEFNKEKYVIVPHQAILLLVRDED
jgi:co-chaperonin GroES (HSP10)